MARSEWEAIAQDSAKKAADAHGRLNKKEEGELRGKAKARAALATPLQIMAQPAAVTPIVDSSGALGEETGEAPPDVPAAVCLYIRKLPDRANGHGIWQGAPSHLIPICQCPLPANGQRGARRCAAGDTDRHVMPIEASKGEFSLRASATTAPGLLKMTLAAIGCRKIRRRLGLGTALGQNPKPKSRR